MSCIYANTNENVYNQYEANAAYQYPQYPQMDMQSSQMYAQCDYNNNYVPQQQEQQVYQQQQQQQYYYTQQQTVPQSCPTTTTYEQPQYQYYNYPQNQQYYIQNNNNNNATSYNNYNCQQNYPVNAYYPNVPTQEYANFKQESIHTKEEFEQQSYQESDKDENQSTCTPSSNHNMNNNQRESISSLPSTISSPAIKSEEISPVNKKTTKKTVKNPTSTASFEKAKQSISKNNIRNFLTPIVRMRAGFVDYQLLEKQNVSTIKYDAFLKQHFYIAGQTRLNIRQTIFDALLDVSDRTQLAEKKVFAMIVVKKIQEQFLKLLLEKSSTFSNQDFKQQFEWINGINESIVEFLNSLSN